MAPLLSLAWLVLKRASRENPLGSQHIQTTVQPVQGTTVQPVQSNSPHLLKTCLRGAVHKALHGMGITTRSNTSTRRALASLGPTGLGQCNPCKHLGYNYHPKGSMPWLLKSKNLNFNTILALCFLSCLLRRSGAVLF